MPTKLYCLQIALLQNKTHYLEPHKKCEIQGGGGDGENWDKTCIRHCFIKKDLKINSDNWALWIKLLLSEMYQVTKYQIINNCSCNALREKSVNIIYNKYFEDIFWIVIRKYIIFVKLHQIFICNNNLKIFYEDFLAE